MVVVLIFGLLSVFSVVSGSVAENLITKGLVGYLMKYGVPLAEEIRQAEDSMDFRIVGGAGANLGQFPYQAGLIVNVGMATAACGGTLVSNNRVATAAHCWEDGKDEAKSVTVVLGSVQLFYGGIRLVTKKVVTHPDWDPVMIMNDIAMIYLPEEVTYSHDLSPINLPSGSELNEDFNGEKVIATGFGKTGTKAAITKAQFLSYVTVEVIPNKKCVAAFPSYVKDSNICTGGKVDQATCYGDSGGPLALTRNNQTILIGITSFGSKKGCENEFPLVFTRTTSYINFLKKNM